MKIQLELTESQALALIRACAAVDYLGLCADSNHWEAYTPERNAVGDAAVACRLALSQACQSAGSTREYSAILANRAFSAGWDYAESCHHQRGVVAA